MVSTRLYLGLYWISDRLHDEDFNAEQRLSVEAYVKHVVYHCCLHHTVPKGYLHALFIQCHDCFSMVLAKRYASLMPNHEDGTFAKKRECIDNMQ